MKRGFKASHGFPHIMLYYLRSSFITFSWSNLISTLKMNNFMFLVPWLNYEKKPMFAIPHHKRENAIKNSIAYRTCIGPRIQLHYNACYIWYPKLNSTLPQYNLTHVLWLKPLFHKTHKTHKTYNFRYRFIHKVKMNVVNKKVKFHVLKFYCWKQ